MMPEVAPDVLDQLVIERLGAVYDAAGADAFEDTATRLVVSVCAMLVHERGLQHVRELVKLIAAGFPNDDHLVLNWVAITAATSAGPNGIKSRPPESPLRR
jgi:hypothetical protein